MNDLWVGCAAGGSGDRVDAARPIVAAMIESGKAGTLIFENLAERTLAFAQLAKRVDPSNGLSCMHRLSGDWKRRTIAAPLGSPEVF